MLRQNKNRAHPATGKLTDMDHKRLTFVLPFIVGALCIVEAAQGGVSESAMQSLQARTASDSESGERELYIVQFADPPAVAAHGNNSRLLGVTAAVAGFDPEAAPVRRYIDELHSKQTRILQALQLEQNPIYSYGYTFNGVAILLSRDEAERLRLRRGIRRVWLDSRRSVATSDSPAFLGLLDPSGGLRADRGLTGENVIIGVIDSGITPNHPSFEDRVEKPRPPRLCRSTWAEESLLGRWLCARFNKPARREYSSPPADWRGVCEAGPGFPAGSCNNKLIGARAYFAGFSQSGAVDPGEFESPADADGHGTHIASIAAGKSVSASVFGADAGRISGIAPRARVAVYKACWLEPGASRATCSVADLQKAIEDAVADGVDIINYSIGDLNDSLDDPDDLALLAAAEAGVLSVVATGNDGPNAFTIQSPATTPWVISVGATSRAGKRVAEALRISAPAALAKDYESREAGFTPRLDDRGPLTAKLVLADDDSTTTPDDEAGSIYDGCTALVNSDQLDGNIALIQRGYCTFDQKIANAGAAGAIAVVVYSNDMNLIVMDGDSTLVDVPAVMIGQADGELIRDKLLAGETVNVTLDKSLFINLADAGNVMGAYSGRGPNFADSDFLKPDLVAPGTAILGAQTPEVANGFRGELYQYLSGTSQSAPHVAGTAALLKQAHPDWSPAELKSALMTSARQNILREDASTPATPFDMGAGHIVPNDAVDPGLLYPVAIQEYDAYLCAIGLQRITQEQCAQLAVDGYTQDARDINLPSVAITELAGNVTVTRRVTNPGPAAQFSVQTSVPDGISLEVNPASLALGTGESAEYTLQFRSDGSGLDRWHYGNIRWVNDSHSVYSPFVVQPTLFSTADELRGTGAAGNLQVPVSFGYDGNYAARINGLFLPCVLPDSDSSDALCTNTEAALVTDDPQDNYVFVAQNPPSSVRRFTINVPSADDELLRVALFDELTSGADDLDVYLYYCPATAVPGFCELVEDGLVDLSATPDTSTEQIDVLNPAAGTWVIDVHGYTTESSDGSRFRLYAWSFGGDNDAGNAALTSAPTVATAGSTTELTISWNGLAPGLWLGGIAHYDDPADPADIPLALTVIEVDSR
jgi:subtilisin family serine protease